MRLPPGAIPNLDINKNAAINVITSSKIVNHPTIKLSKVPIIKCTNISKLLEVKSTSSTLEIINNDNAVQSISEISTSHSCKLNINYVEINKNKYILIVRRNNTNVIFYNKYFIFLDSEKDFSFPSKECSFADVSEITISNSTPRENFSSPPKKSPFAEFRYVLEITASDVNIPRENFSSPSKKRSFADVSEITTSDISTPREDFSSPKKRPFAHPRYISEITIFDVSTPSRAKKVINFVKKVNENKCKQIKFLQDQNRKLLMRVTTLQNLISYLKESNLISDDATDNLIVSK